VAPPGSSGAPTDPSEAEAVEKTTSTEGDSAAVGPTAAATAAPAPDLQLVILYPDDKKPKGDATPAERRAAHRAHLDDLGFEGVRAASALVDDNRRILVIAAPTLGMLGERLRGDPYFGHPYQMSAAPLGFIIGGLCSDPESGTGRELQMIFFSRDVEVLRSGGWLAPDPFGPELGELEQVVMVGSWGLGHRGVVLVDAASVQSATELLDQWPLPLDPQWEVKVNGITMVYNNFCRRP
jgi:hypothetical protein